MNRAVQGDVVVVEVFDEKEWKAPADEVVDQEGMFRTSLATLLANVSLKLPSKMMMPKTRVTKMKEIKRFLWSRKFSAQDAPKGPPPRSSLPDVL